MGVLCGVIGYGVMNLLMTATPLAMDGHHHPFGDAAFVIQWHLIGMFAPSFVTGSLISRFGLVPVMLTGVALSAACIAISINGADVAHFWLALTLLGVGWNFMYVGGTTLLTECHTAAERAKTQAANDFTVFVTMAMVGFADDFIKVRMGRNLGLNKTTKFVGQAIIACLFAFVGPPLAGIPQNISVVGDITLDRDEVGGAAGGCCAKTLAGNASSRASEYLSFIVFSGG